MSNAPIIGIARHRLGRDGDGVTTLVAFHGCPLSCRFCLNPQCKNASGVSREVDVEGLLAELEIDNLYFLATGGGVTFGGGEPLLRCSFIKEFCQQADKDWKINIETCLNVDGKRLEMIVPFVHEFIIDVKDMSESIYKSYTGMDNHNVVANLQYLADLGLQERCVVRLPRIAGYNTESDISTSRQMLESMNFSRFDVFDYIVKK